MVFGAVVDSACLVLQGGGECSKRKGACLLYDSNKFKNYMHGFVVAIRVSIICHVIVKISNCRKSHVIQEKVTFGFCCDL